MLKARQRSALSGFTYDWLDASGRRLGTLEWPDFAVAENSWLKGLVPANLSQAVRLEQAGVQYEIVHELLRPGESRDSRFSLRCDEQETASAKILVRKRLMDRRTIRLTSPFVCQLIRKSSLLLTRYEVQLEGQAIGSLSEKPGFSLKRELRLELPETVSRPVQFFLLFLVCNDPYR